MQQWGNKRARKYYEARVPRDYKIPDEHSTTFDLERWIRDKYELKRFVKEVREMSMYRRRYMDQAHRSGS